jgi:sporadic carbohydrate cluster 2OG-Fe(II) oxygenase
MNNLKKELINGKGYAILPIDDLENFKILCNEFIKKISPYTKTKNFSDIRQEMTEMSKSQINELMVSLLSFNDASEVLINSCKNIVKSLSGDEIFLQRRANTIFNIPGQDQRRQWPHYELMSGVSPFTYILWAPFHDLDENDGVFYLDLNKSHEMIKSEQSTGIVNGPMILNKNYDEKPAKLKFGEVIVFCPFVLHGNINFNSNLARIACSVRFQSIHQPLLQKDTDYFKFHKI